MDDFSKIATRVCHLTSVGFLTGVTTLNYFCNTASYLTDNESYASAKLVTSLTAFVSGVLMGMEHKAGKDLEGG